MADLPPSYSQHTIDQERNESLIQYILITNNFDQLNEIAEIINHPGVGTTTRQIYLQKIKNLPPWQFKFLNAKLHVFIPPKSQSEKYTNLIIASFLIGLITNEFRNIVPGLSVKLKDLRREIYNLMYNDKKIKSFVNIMNEFANNT